MPAFPASPKGESRSAGASPPAMRDGGDGLDELDEFYGGSPLHWGGKLGRKARWAVRGGQKAVVGERHSKFCFGSGATNMSCPTKKSLLARVRSGDEISWREFYETCRPLVFLVGGLRLDLRRERGTCAAGRSVKSFDEVSKEVEQVTKKDVRE